MSECQNIHATCQISIQLLQELYVKISVLSDNLCSITSGIGCQNINPTCQTSLQLRLELYVKILEHPYVMCELISPYRTHEY